MPNFESVPQKKDDAIMSKNMMDAARAAASPEALAAARKVSSETEMKGALTEAERQMAEVEAAQAGEPNAQEKSMDMEERKKMLEDIKKGIEKSN
jgi:hypothetical protein